MHNPRIEANRLHSLPDCYKIKLRSSGYRLSAIGYRPTISCPRLTSLSDVLHFVPQ